MVVCLTRSKSTAQSSFPIDGRRLLGRNSVGGAEVPMTKHAKPRLAIRSSWDIYLAQHSPAKWIGTVEAIDKNARLRELLSCSGRAIRAT
jgi:hypothetical protein